MNLKSLSGYCLSLLIICNTSNASEHTNTPSTDNKDYLNLYVKYGKPFCYVFLGSIMSYLLYNWYIDKTSIALHSVEPCQPLPIYNTAPETSKKRTKHQIVRVTKQSKRPRNERNLIEDNSESKMRPTNYLHSTYGQLTTLNSVNIPQEQIVIPEAYETQQISEISDEEIVVSAEEKIVESVTATSHEIVTQEDIAPTEIYNAINEICEYTQEAADISSIPNEYDIDETEEILSTSEASTIVEDTNNDQATAAEFDISETNSEDTDQELINLQQDQNETTTLYRGGEELIISDDENTDDTDIISDNESTGYDTDSEDDIFQDIDDNEGEADQYNAIFE